jgi:hypothetical protein
MSIYLQDPIKPLRAAAQVIGKGHGVGVGQFVVAQSGPVGIAQVVLVEYAIGAALAGGRWLVGQWRRCFT